MTNNDYYFDYNLTPKLLFVPFPLCLSILKKDAEANERISVRIRVCVWVRKRKRKRETTASTKLANKETYRGLEMLRISDISNRHKTTI